MQCPSCSQEIKDTAKWCGYCGHKIEQATPPPEPESIDEIFVAEEVPVEIKPAPETKVEEPAQGVTLPEPEIIVEKPAKREAPLLKEKVPGIKPEPVTEKEEMPALKPTSVKVKAPKKEKIGKSASKPVIATDERKRVPAWVWIIVVVFLMVGMVFGLQFFKSEDVILAWNCPHNVTVSENTPLKISYGYWGYLAAYHQQNYDSIDFQLYIDGTRYYGERVKETLTFSDAPCLNTSPRFNAYWQEHSSWIYDVVQIDGLPAGKYQVEVFTYSDFDIVDGMKDDNGDLIHYGPGIVVSSDYTLTVR